MKQILNSKPFNILQELMSSLIHESINDYDVYMKLKLYESIYSSSISINLPVKSLDDK